MKRIGCLMNCLTVYVENDQTELATLNSMIRYCTIVLIPQEELSYGTTSITLSSNATRARDTMIRTYKNQNKLEKLKDNLH